MKLGVYLRNMGPSSERATIIECARAADEARIDDLWLADHIAIPPDDAEGSNGRYLDPLATLAYLAGATQHIGLGTGVLVLPYRPALATAKWVATIQELSAGRLLLGVGAGWMPAEFRAVGVDRRRRGAITDATLRFFHQAFSADEVESNGQRFLFKPRPVRPQIFVGGAPPHALRRTVEFGDAWLPIGSDLTTLRPAVAQLRDLAASAGRSMPEVAMVTSLPLDDPGRAIDQVRELAAAGVSRVIHGWRYATASEFRRAIDIIAQRVRPALSSSREVPE